MVDLLELVARTFVLLGASTSGDALIPALVVLGFIGASAAATVLIAEVVRARAFLPGGSGPTPLREVENLRVLVAHSKPDAPGHVRSRAPGGAIAIVGSMGHGLQ